MAGGAVDGLALAGGRPGTKAGVGRAQGRASLDDLAGQVRAGLAGDLAGLRLGYPRVTRCAARVGGLSRMARGEVVAGPFPDVAGHVIEAVGAGGKRSHWGSALIAVGEQVLPG